jgi:Phosphoribosyl transferase domain
VDPFRDLMFPPITLEGFKALRLMQPKRICFSSTHKNALKQNETGGWAGSLFLPFNETVAQLLPWTLYPKTGDRGRYYHLGIKTQDELASIKAWIEAHSDLVFIRSLFDTAVATCEHFGSNNSRSRIGELEHAAKYDGDNAARSQLVAIIKSAYDRLHQVRNISAIVSVPASVQGTASLPNFLADRLGAEVALPDLTVSLNWNGSKSKIKELGVDVKWQALEKVGLTAGNDVAGKNLLLIDDMYQSGATAHFVASRLRAAGANEIHLLAVSKGRRDTDNK